MKKQILIADKRRELSTKYKKLIESLGHSVIISSKLNEIFKIVQDIEPDLILISDSIVENLSDICRQLRVLTFNTRPIIISISKSAEVDDRLKVLENGADDFLSEPISSQEFKMRIFAHLRREQEGNIDNISGLANKKCVLKEIKRTLVKNEKRAFMLISIENFMDYKSIYSDIASDRLVQTFTAIMKTSISETDFLGQLSENEFFIITNPMYCEKISAFLTFAFDSVAEKFYSQTDLKRGYIILQGDEKEGRRGEFLHCAIGVITNEYKSYFSPDEVLNSLYNVHQISIKPSGSSYLIERPQLSAEDSIIDKEFNNKIVIIEEDDALSFLLATTIELQGYNVECKTCLEDFSDVPAIIILDAGKIDNLKGLEICSALKKKFINTKVIMTSVLHDKEKILNSGADLYLPKPYNLVNLMKWINIFLKEFNN